MSGPKPTTTKVKALIAVDLQNDFLLPESGLQEVTTEDGRVYIPEWPCPPSSTEPLFESLEKLVPAFREQGGHVIWVKAIYANPAKQPLEKECSKHAELSDPWLKSATHVHPFKGCCAEGSPGSSLHPRVQTLVDPAADSVVTKTFYSVFTGSSRAALLDLLRKKGVTEVYFCGLASNTCVMASVLCGVDLRERRTTLWHGIDVVVDEQVLGCELFVVEDCLGWRWVEKHAAAMEKLRKLEGEGKLKLVSAATLTGRRRCEYGRGEALLF